MTVLSGSRTVPVSMSGIKVSVGAGEKYAFRDVMYQIRPPSQLFGVQSAVHILAA